MVSHTKEQGKADTEEMIAATPGRSCQLGLGQSVQQLASGKPDVDTTPRAACQSGGNLEPHHMGRYAS